MGLELILCGFSVNTTFLLSLGVENLWILPFLISCKLCIYNKNSKYVFLFSFSVCVLIRKKAKRTREHTRGVWKCLSTILVWNMSWQSYPIALWSEGTSASHWDSNASIPRSTWGKQPALGVSWKNSFLVWLGEYDSLFQFWRKRFGFWLEWWSLSF